MRIYEGIEKSHSIKNPVVTVGTFDGVHLGHQKIIEHLNAAAAAIQGESVILTFHPHPRMVLFPDDDDIKLLSTEEEKKELLERFAVEHLIIHPFTKKFSRTTYLDFVRGTLIHKIRMKKLVIGYNHHLGRNREGSFRDLKKLSLLYNFQLEKIPAQMVNKVEISSSKIRRALECGDIRIANKFLGYEYSIGGEIIKGKGLGRELGYPTANIQINDKYKLIPANGIYAVKAEMGNNIYRGMMCIGMNPTVNGEKRAIEVNIFDFEKNIYGETIRIFFEQKIRDEKKFNSLEELKQAIGNDREKALSIFSD